MSRLSFYLSRQYVVQGLSLFGAVVFLVWINQTLLLFDLITEKGQSLFTLFGQSLLAAAPLSRAMLHICIGIGMVRTLDALQTSKELHTIHATRRISALWSSVVLTGTFGALLVALLAHFVEPLSYRYIRDWQEQVAADLVGRTLEPHQFREITPGFVVQIGGRLPDGTITNFFADDSRSDTSRRTYEARRASINSDADGLYLALENGRIQHQAPDGSFTEIGFANYQIGLDSLAEEGPHRSQIDETTTWGFFRISLERSLAPYERWNLEGRWMEIPLMYATCLLAVAMVGFPRGARRGPGVPTEIIVVVVALFVRIFNEQSMLFNIKGLLGVVILAGLAVAILAYRAASPYLPRIARLAS